MNVYVLGRGRCGTSLIARIFKDMGFSSKSELTEPSISGYMESAGDEDMEELHKMTVDAHYSNEDINYNGFNIEKKTSHIDKKEFQRLFKDLMSKRKDFVWKSHTVISLMDYIVEIDEPYIVVAYRRDVEVQADSMASHLWGARHRKNETLKQIEKQKEKINEFFKKYPKTKRLDIYFEDLLENPEKEIRRMCEFTNKEYNGELLSLVQQELPRFYRK